MPAMHTSFRSLAVNLLYVCEAVAMPIRCRLHLLLTCGCPVLSCDDLLLVAAPPDCCTWRASYPKHSVPQCSGGRALRQTRIRRTGVYKGKPPSVAAARIHISVFTKLPLPTPSRLCHRIPLRLWRARHLSSPFQRLPSRTPTPGPTLALTSATGSPTPPFTTNYIRSRSVLNFEHHINVSRLLIYVYAQSVQVDSYRFRIPKHHLLNSPFFRKVLHVDVPSGPVETFCDVDHIEGVSATEFRDFLRVLIPSAPYRSVPYKF